MDAVSALGLAVLSNEPKYALDDWGSTPLIYAGDGAGLLLLLVPNPLGRLGNESFEPLSFLKPTEGRSLLVERGGDCCCCWRSTRDGELICPFDRSEALDGLDDTLPLRSCPFSGACESQGCDRVLVDGTACSPSCDNIFDLQGRSGTATAQSASV